jgi:hypothetical protein
MAATHSTGTPPTQTTFLDRMGRVDACPTTCGNTETPVTVAPRPTGFAALYACTDCGHRWVTSWED